MTRYRYRSPKWVGESHLPTDSVCTILTRQSTLAQGERNIFSAEQNANELVTKAVQMGFDAEHVQVLDWDMGIGAYNTTIEERPALHYWLTELLPSGKSRVVMTSQEDRLFRDRTEIQVNRFIEQVSQLGGWVICGTRVYNFRNEMDREQFRLVCKFGKQYIEFHVKGRLHPARDRAAWSGRWIARLTPWGYICDYQQMHVTYKHLIRYEPHVTLLQEEVFRRFSRMLRPTVAELVRGWRCEGLVWPFFSTDLDEHSYRRRPQHRQDVEKGGYTFSLGEAQSTLTNPAYLGWVLWKGQLALDSDQQAPKVCHEPLVDEDLFWWCFDHIERDRPDWAPMKRTQVVCMNKARRVRNEAPDTVRFLVHGQIRCAVHQKTMAAVVEKGPNQTVGLVCIGNNRQYGEEGNQCASISVGSVENSVCTSFLEQLTLSDIDVVQFARIAHQQEQAKTGMVTRYEQQLEEQRRVFERAKQAMFAASDLASDFFDVMRQAKQTIAELQHQIAEASLVSPVSSQAWLKAQRVSRFAKRIQDTFLEWSRQAQARVLSLALQEGVVGRVDRWHDGLWLRWQGGAESRREIARLKGHYIDWTPEEDEVLRQYFAPLSWPALLAMLPGRTRFAIATRAFDTLRLTRPRRGSAHGSDVVPCVVTIPEGPNEMESWGFPLVMEGNDGERVLSNRH